MRLPESRVRLFFWGEFYAETFRKAVLIAVSRVSPEDYRRYFNAEKLTYWACRFFDNETDARKSFG